MESNKQLQKSAIFHKDLVEIFKQAERAIIL
jgi:hypothetical protein